MAFRAVALPSTGAAVRTRRRPGVRGTVRAVAHPLDPKLARLLRRQYGAFAQRQAVALGFKQPTIHMRFRRNRYRELLPGVGAEHGAPDTWDQRAMAALLWAGGDAALARGSAGRLHGWELPSRATRKMHLLTRCRSRSVPAGLVLHRSASFDPSSDVHTAGPLRFTSPDRTIVDLAAVLTPGELRDVVAEAVRRGQAHPGSLGHAMQRAGRVAGMPALRRILAELSPLHAACRSWLESAYVDLTDGTGLEPDAMNHPVRDARGDRRLLDAVYLPEHLPVELDGKETHTTVLDVADDEDREKQVRLAGPWCEFLRFTHEDVVERGGEVLAAVEAALRAAGSDRRWTGRARP